VIDMKPACSRMIDVLHGVTIDQLTRTSPCTEYTVGDLIDHVDQVSRMFTALAQRDTGEPKGSDYDPDTAHRDPGWRERVARHVRALGQAWDDPAAWEGTTNLSGPDLSNDLWGKITLTELVVHGWDIAQATGQPFGLPEPVLHACLHHVTEFVTNAPIPGLWGPPVDVPDGAALLDQIVAITGRTP
jgi:uncharacterized protein (TIGR03086 family)